MEGGGGYLGDFCVNPVVTSTFFQNFANIFKLGSNKIIFSYKFQNVIILKLYWTPQPEIKYIFNDNRSG